MEQRRHQRARTLKAARILFNHHHSAITCTVRNLSPAGACLEVASTVGIPQCFDVIFEADRSIRGCRTIWLRERQLGVEFASPAGAALTGSV
jgi:hypothetical protein